MPARQVTASLAGFVAAESYSPPLFSLDIFGGMPSEHRCRLLNILARLDQLSTGAEEILEEPVTNDNLAAIFLTNFIGILWCKV
jgi:hypothetical protein